MLDLTPFTKALASLRKSLEYCQSNLAKGDIEIYRQFRGAAIQAFEYTFEISIKMLRRQLEEMESPREIERATFRDLMRIGAEKELINNPQPWFEFREKRNITSHSYDEAKAEEIFAVLPDFVEKATFLLEQLKQY